jgi:hypothetical protein
MEIIDEELEKLDFFTAREAADICHFKGTEAIKRAIKRGELPAIHLSNTQILVPKDAFLRWLKAHRTGGTPGSGVLTLRRLSEAPVKALEAIAAKRAKERRSKNVKTGDNAKK